MEKAIKKAIKRKEDELKEEIKRQQEYFKLEEINKCRPKLSPLTEEEYYDLIVDFAEISLERKRREEIINSEEYKRREEKRLEQQCRFLIGLVPYQGS